MEKLSVREFDKRDADFLSRIEEEYFSSPMSGEYIESIPEKKNTCFFVCEEDNGIIAGYAGMMWVLDEGSIISIAVEEAKRKAGIGTMLLEALFEKSLELELASLTLEVRSGNSPAIHLYEKNGFTVCGRMKNYYSYPKEDAIIMTRYFK